MSERNEFRSWIAENIDLGTMLEDSDVETTSDSYDSSISENYELQEISDKLIAAAATKAAKKAKKATGGGFFGLGGYDDYKNIKKYHRQMQTFGDPGKHRALVNAKRYPGWAEPDPNAPAFGAAKKYPGWAEPDPNAPKPRVSSPTPEPTSKPPRVRSPKPTAAPAPAPVSEPPPTKTPRSRSPKPSSSSVADFLGKHKGKLIAGAAVATGAGLIARHLYKKHQIEKQIKELEAKKAKKAKAK